MASIEQISNNEAGSSVRTKLNLAITEANKVDSKSENDHTHSNLPTADEKAALAGTGTPSASNKYATESSLTKLIGINEQTGTTYTLALTDAGKLVRISNAAAITLTVPKNSSVAFATGTRILVEQQGAGVITVAPVDGDVTINSIAKKTWGQYSVIELVKLGTNLWNVIGGSV